jgi:hypothetical protein
MKADILAILGTYIRYKLAMRLYIEVPRYTTVKLEDDKYMIDGMRNSILYNSGAINYNGIIVKYIRETNAIQIYFKRLYNKNNPVCIIKNPLNYIFHYYNISILINNRDQSRTKLTLIKDRYEYSHYDISADSQRELKRIIDEYTDRKKRLFSIKN